MILNKIFTDSPVGESTEDRFQRYEFAKRIANTIVENPQKDGIVIGIYGAWGEGKTSVINFIKKELEEYNNVSIVNFNPWRYNNEKALLHNFFSILASVLDANLKTGKEKAGDILKKYGSILNFEIPFIGGNMGEIADSVGNFLSEVDIEKLKYRVEKIICDRGKKIVVFIDDIDRLDKNEIYSIFRLVKLTADFINTTYILSFDEKMVSAAIGDRYGSGDEKAGKEFLEKIIQVPLNIPKAQSEALQKYCLELISKVIEAHDITISEDDLKTFGYQFTTNIANVIDTPRMAVRYANTLSFSLPLLNNEVNIADLMLIEAIKIFYPKHYNFIKHNPDYFICNYKNIIDESDNEKKEYIKETIEQLEQGYSQQQQKCIIDLIQHLFPYIKEAYTEWFVSPYISLNLYKKKNIGSDRYFDRYFSYTVIKGDLSDVEFNNFMDSINHYNIQQISDSIKQLTADTSVYSFIFKMRAIEDSIKWDNAKKLLYVLPEIGELFPNTHNPLTMGVDSPKTQLAIFICQLLKSQPDRNERLLTGKEVLSKADTLGLANEIIRWTNVGKTDEDKTFNENEIKTLKGILIERFISEAGDIPIYFKHTNLYYLFNDWNEYDRKGMTQYIKKHIKKNPNDIFSLLRSVMSKMSISNKVLDIDKEKFEFIDTVFNKEFIRKSIVKIYPLKIIHNDTVVWKEHTNEELTNIDIARQFLYWYNIAKSTK